MQKLRDLERQGRAVRFISKTATIDVSKLPESITPIRREYSYNVRIRGRDEFAQLQERMVTVTSDRKTLSPGEIEGIAENYLDDVSRYEELEDVEVTILEGMRRGEFAE